MELLTATLAISLGLLAVALGSLATRGIRRYLATRNLPQLAWGTGLALGAAAMAVEAVVYVGYVSSILLQAYVFFSAAIVGVLSLGSTRILRRPRFEQAYAGFMVAACGLVAAASFATPLSGSMVSGGVISGNPPLLLLLLSSIVTVPATVVLIGSAIVALRRSPKWQTTLMIAGAFVLGAGGTLYIASFPVMLYYAEFIGIGLLFLGLISLPNAAAAPHSAARPAPGAP